MKSKLIYMKLSQITLIGLSLTVLCTSCSVQQFAVNTVAEPFENGGNFWGENTEYCGEKPWKLPMNRGKDIHVLGINIQKSDTKKMAEELDAQHYTIETKSNLVLSLLTAGILDYKIVKVIKRAQ